MIFNSKIYMNNFSNIYNITNNFSIIFINNIGNNTGDNTLNNTWNNTWNNTGNNTLNNTWNNTGNNFNENNKKLPNYFFIGVFVITLIVFGCFFTYLMHECNFNDCLNYGFKFNQIKKKIKNTYNTFCINIENFCITIEDYCILLPSNIYRYNNNNDIHNHGEIVINIDNPYKYQNTTEYNYEEKSLQFKQEQCSICQEVTESKQVTTECGHVFCKECIEIHLKNNNSCPNCRTIITKLYNNII